MPSNDIISTARTYREVQAQIKALEEELDALKAVMVRTMDEQKAEALQAGEYTIRYSIYESTRLDSTKLKTDAPELYSQYAKRTTALRFTVA